MSPDYDVVIVGAGISGIGMAAHLAEKCPGKRFVLLEARERLGGTWDLFRYPGVRSDSDMYTLGYAFAPWTGERAIAEGAEVLAYLERIAAERGVADHIRYGRRVTSADWNGAAGLWRLALEGGTEAVTARFVFLGSGYYDYARPHEAEIPGLETFAGPVAHPQFWPEDLDCAGQRVVVIGSGATAVSLVPALAERAAHVTMLQRTPGWMVSLPSRDRLADILRRLLPARWAHALVRARNTWLQDWLFKRCRRAPEAMADYFAGLSRAEFGPDWREDMVPPYGPWEQRLCITPDGDLATAVRAARATIVTGRIAQVERDGVRLESSEHLPADIIVTATGLRLAVGGGIAFSLDGDPIRFAEHFHYRNCMYSNVPNLAALFGYLNAGWTLRVDIVADWLCRLFNQMDAWGAEVVTPWLPADHGLVEENPIDRYSSGYLQRARPILPKSSTTAPWRITMDYLADRRELREAPIDDGVLRFWRAPQVARHPSASSG